MCTCVICLCVRMVCVCVRSLTRQPHMDDMFYNQQQQHLQYQQHLQDGSRLLTSVHNPATNTDLPPSSIGMSGNVDTLAVYLFPTRLPPLDLTLGCTTSNISLTPQQPVSTHLILQLLLLPEPALAITTCLPVGAPGSSSCLVHPVLAI